MTNKVISDFEINSAPGIKMASEGATEVFSWPFCGQENSAMNESNVPKQLMSEESLRTTALITELPQIHPAYYFSFLFLSISDASTVKTTSSCGCCSLIDGQRSGLSSNSDEYMELLGSSLLFHLKFCKWDDADEQSCSSFSFAFY